MNYKIIMGLLLLASSVTAYVPIKIIGGGSMKCLDNATTCSGEGYIYNRNNPPKDTFFENKHTYTYLLIAIISIMMIVVIYKAGGGGKTCIIAS